MRRHPSTARLVAAFSLALGALPVAAQDGPQSRPHTTGVVERPASTHLEKLLESLFPAIVKVHGAAGVSTIQGYMSGCLVSPKGHVLTIDHVMLQPGQTRVVIDDGTVCEATILRRDEKLGVAMLKIDPPQRAGKVVELPFLKAPDTVDLWPGRVLVSLGNAFRLAEYGEKVSATFGVMTARVRMDLRFRLQKFNYPGEVIVTDAPNNPGSLGGGLFTLDGQWIGLNGPMVESAETNTAISLAYPTADLRAFIALSTGDEATARRLAAQATSETKEKKPVFHGIVLFDTGLRRSPPAYIERVIAGSPAATAGLRTDDLVIRLNDFPVGTCNEFHRVMKSFAPGDRIAITFKRGSEVIKLDMTLAAAKESEKR